MHIKGNAMIVQNTDSVTAAVRHFARQMMPTGWRRNGMLVQGSTLHVEVKEKEDATNV